MTELEKVQYKAARLYFTIAALTRGNEEPTTAVENWAYDTLLDTAISAKIYAEASKDHSVMLDDGR